MAGRARRGGLLLLTAVVVLLATASGASAAAPRAITGPVTAVGSATATVTGTRQPGRRSDDLVRRVRDEDGYGSKSAAKSAGSGTANVAVSAGLTGLKAGTTYHYRVVATNGAGTSHGTDAVFTTTVPPDVTTGAASGISASAATLNGTVDPNSRDTTFYFEYGSSTSYGTKTPTKSAGSADEPCSRIGRHLGPADRPHLSLPHRRDERRRHEPPARTPRSRPARPNGHDGRRDVAGSDHGNA